jgi:hypothetical protein
MNSPPSPSAPKKSPEKKQNPSVLPLHTQQYQAHQEPTSLSRSRLLSSQIMGRQKNPKIRGAREEKSEYG